MQVRRLKARVLRLERTKLFSPVERLARFLVRVSPEVRLSLEGCLDLCCREAKTVAFRCAWGLTRWERADGMSECTRGRRAVVVGVDTKGHLGTQGRGQV